jgi:NTP pyrophosphatase (non-canonical NTP hydrolase)
MEYVKNPVVVATRKEQHFLKDDYKKEINLRENHIHTILGISTELGELAQAFMNQDMVNVKEEIGDLFWYTALAFDTLGLEPLKNLDENNINPDTVFPKLNEWMDKINRSLFYKDWLENL